VVRFEYAAVAKIAVITALRPNFAQWHWKHGGGAELRLYGGVSGVRRAQREVAVLTER